MITSPDRSTGRSSRLKSGPSAGSNPAPGAVALPHGYTVADLDHFARAAAAMGRTRAMHPHDRYDTAWSAIAMALCEAELPPVERDLVITGRRAIDREMGAMRHTFGVRDKSSTGHVATSPRFVAYWTLPMVHPSDALVEEVAVRQVLASLKALEREAVRALAETDDYRAAAQALGIRDGAFRQRLVSARRTIRAHWYAPETPPPIKGTDRRVGAYDREAATHCGNGHLWTDENTRWHRCKNGRRRVCADCERARHQARQLPHPAARDGGARAAEETPAPA